MIGFTLITNINIHPASKFSIITVTYNAEKELEGTIRNVLAQIYQNIEYIIIDGASKDKTPAIIEKYRQYIHILVSEPDKGLYDAMNKGMALPQATIFVSLMLEITFTAKMLWRK